MTKTLKLSTEIISRVGGLVRDPFNKYICMYIHLYSPLK